ncbi:MAG TPA: FG-GAP-like repeat-containing protein [Bacteroidia bacterium]|nr:FG-GAP-like repeat-containing protein [Bacteroidia bacterium]
MNASSGSSITVTGLSPGTWYDFNVFDYDDDAPTYYNYRSELMCTGEVQTGAGAVPVITNMSPATGPVGTVVTLTGSNFGSTVYNNIVYFGATRATVTAASATSLTVVVPYGANYNPVSVQVDGLTGTYSKEFIVTSSCAATINASSFTNSSVTTSGPTIGNVIKDIDNDGKSDFMVQDYGGSVFNAFRGTSSNGTTPPAFTANTYGTVTNPYFMECADFDLDSKPDVAMTDYIGGKVSIFRGNGTYFSTATRFDFATLPYPAMVKSGDIDGDGRPDLVVSYGTGTYISVFRNTGSITNIDFAARQDFNIGTNTPFSLVVRDFDLDGKADIAVGQSGGTNFYAMRSTSTPGSVTFAAVQAFSAGTGNVNGLTTGDFNLDGKADIAVALSNNTVRLYGNNSTVGSISFSYANQLTTASSNPIALASNDLDGDGKIDLAVGYSSANTVSVFEATGPYGFATRVDYATAGSESACLSIGDFNQDGKSDILASTFGSSVNILSNAMNALASEPPSTASNLTFSGVTQSSITLNFTPGTGANRIVVCRQGGAVTILPADGTTYTGNSVFGSGTDVGGGEYCVYNGNSNSVTVTNLQSNTYYYFAIFEYNGSTCTTNYLTAPYASSNTQTLNTPPTLSAISNPPAICQNSGQQTVNFSGVGTGAANETQTLTVTATSNNTSVIPNPTVTYTSPNATGSLSYTPVPSATGSATITVTVNDGASNNATTTQTFVVTVSPPPTPSNAGPDQQICTGTATLGANAPSVGTGVWSIAYTSNVSITTANLGNVNIPTTTLTGLTVGDSVRLAWTITSSPCNPSVSYVSIKRTNCPLTAGFTWSPQNLCATALQVNNISFTDASFAPSTTITSWSWSFTGPIAPSPSNSSQQNPSNIQFTGPGTFTVTLTINDNVGGNSTTTQFITINQYPAGSGTISGPSTVCQGQTGVTYSVLPIAYATSYNWALPPGATIVNGAGTPTIIVDFDSNASSGSVQVQGVNSCGAGAASPIYNVTVNPLPVNTSSVNGPSSVCQGQNNVMFTTPSIPYATGYTWTLPSGATIIGNPSNDTIYVNFSGSAQSGTVDVIGTNSCGAGTSSVGYMLNVNPLPDSAGTITTNQTGIICQGQTGVTYSISALNNSNYYEWTVPAGATIVSGDSTSSITVDYGSSAVSGNVTVSGVNSCGNGTSSSLAVTVAPLPAPASSVLGQDTVCQGEFSVSYFVSAISNSTSYVWSIPGGSSIATGQNTNSITVDFGPGATNGQIVVYGQNVCGTGTPSAPLDVVVNPLPDSGRTVTGPSAVCQGDSAVTFSVNTIANATGYDWHLPPGANITAGNNTNSITVDFSTTAISGPVYVTGTNACGMGATSDTLNLIVNPLPDPAGTMSGPATLAICPISTGIVFSVPPVNNASYYVWSLPPGATIVSGDSTNSITVDFAPGASPGAATVYAQNACGTGAPSQLSFNFDQVTPVDICEVTVDGNSVYNHVIWNKPVATDIDSFRVYREITANNYVHIGSVPYDSLSVYVDSVYVPTADPNTTYFRYELSSVDSCGNESPLCAHHRTLFLQANVGLGNTVNLNWSLYEGATVDYYRILRDSTGMGNWQVIDSVAGTTNLYTDQNPPMSVNVVDIRYKLQTVWALSCSPSRNIVTSESNLKDVPIAAFSVHENVLDQLVNVFPNPSDGNFTVQCPYSSSGYVISVYDELGQLVYVYKMEAKNMNPGENTFSLPLSTLAKGTYYMTMEDGNNQPMHKKLVIQ